MMWEGKILRENEGYQRPTLTIVKCQFAVTRPFGNFQNHHGSYDYLLTISTASQLSSHLSCFILPIVSSNVVHYNDVSLCS